ncbi:hypothetical protein KW481_03260 [Vibrio fluvialis]|nr:hypothetical protein [Vibrio fluvialis]
MGMTYFLGPNDEVFALDASMDEVTMENIVAELSLIPIEESAAIEKANTPIINALSEHQWVRQELNRVEIELMYHWTDDNRATATEDEWKAYARALRDYTSLGEGDNPIVVGDARPIAPEA